MEKVIKVFIADPSEDFRRLLCDAVDGEEDMYVCGSTDSGTEALEMMERNRPDVLLTGLLLRDMDGIELLKSLREREGRIKTIVLSGFFSQRAASSISCLGVDFYFLKPCRTGEVLRRIRLVCSGRPAYVPAASSFDPVISECLMAFGIPPHIQGYHFIRESIRRTIVDPATLRGVTKILYPELAKAHHSTALNVERAMRHAITVGWERTDAEYRDGYFGPGLKFRRKPTNSEFIALMAEFVTRKYLPEEMGL